MAYCRWSGLIHNLRNYLNLKMMDLQTRKLSLIEEVLHVQNSELLEKVAAYLHQLTQPDHHSLDDLMDDLPLMPTRCADELKARLE